MSNKPEAVIPISQGDNIPISNNCLCSVEATSLGDTISIVVQEGIRDGMVNMGFIKPHSKHFSESFGHLESTPKFLESLSETQEH